MERECYRPGVLRTNRAMTSFPLVRNEATVPGMHHLEKQLGRIKAKRGRQYVRAEC